MVASVVLLMYDLPGSMGFFLPWSVHFSVVSQIDGLIFSVLGGRLEWDVLALSRSSAMCEVFGRQPYIIVVQSGFGVVLLVRFFHKSTLWLPMGGVTQGVWRPRRPVSTYGGCRIRALFVVLEVSGGGRYALLLCSRQFLMFTLGVGALLCKGVPRKFPRVSRWW